jgi:hypothetical protein
VSVFDIHYPVTESSGEWHVGPLLDTRQLRVSTARDAAIKHLHLARAARIAGDNDSWSFYMSRAAGWRKELASLNN